MAATDAVKNAVTGGGKVGTALKIAGVGVLVCAFGAAAAAIPAGQVTVGAVLSGGAKTLGHWGASAVSHTGGFLQSIGQYANAHIPT